MRKILAILSCSILSICHAFAGSGYSNDCSASIQINDKTYALGSCSSNSLLLTNNANLGIMGAFTLGEIKQKTFENGADNVTTASLFYRIFPTASGSANVAFQSVNLTTINNLGNGEELREANPSLNLLVGVQTNTDYTIEFYMQSYLANGNSFTLKNGNNNFSTSFKTPNILPVKFTSFTVAAQNNKNQIRFKTGSENDLNDFVIMRSNNGNNFTSIGTVPATNNGGGNEYVFDDNAPLNGNNFYKIICTNRQGEKTYTNVIRNFFGKIDNSLSLFPNPTVDYLKVNFYSNVRGRYQLSMYNDAGQSLHSQEFTHNGADRTISLDLPKSMKKGPYRIFITNGSDFYIGTFIVQ